MLAVMWFREKLSAFKTCLTIVNNRVIFVQKNRAELCGKKHGEIALGCLNTELNELWRRTIRHDFTVDGYVDDSVESFGLNDAKMQILERIRHF